MLEKGIEQKSRKHARKMGGWLIKLTWIKGIPDRLLILPGGLVAFIEFKQPGEKPKPIQAYRLRQIRKMGFTAVCLDSYEEFTNLVNDLQQKSNQL